MTDRPYPADTKARGWRFELDLEQISQSDTWAVASPEMRPWLLMLWSVSWQQVPCGSLPNDDQIIAARIGMRLSTFTKNKAILLRGWAAHDDGRLYHPTITQRVLAMLETKQKEKDRKAAYRAKMATTVPRDSHGTDEESRWSDPGRDATGTRTGTRTGLVNPSDSQSAFTDSPHESLAEAVCARLRKAGITGANPTHPRLLVLLSEGVGCDEIASVGEEERAFGKSLSWVLAAVEGRRSDAIAKGVSPVIAEVPPKQPDVCCCCGKRATKRVGREWYCQEHDQFSERIAA